MPDKTNDTVIATVMEQLMAEGPQAMAPIITALMNLAMRMEREQFLGAGHYERAVDRRGYANGTKPKLIDTLAGTLSLDVPKTAGTDEPYYPQALHNLLGHAPNHLHDELTEDYRDMIYAATAAEVENRRQAFLRKWRLKCRAVADSLGEAGDRLFAFTRLDPSQWKSARTTNAIERLNEEFRRRIKTQTVLPCADTVPMLFWALLASGQINMRKVDGWQTLAQPIEPIPLDRAA